MTITNSYTKTIERLRKQMEMEKLDMTLAKRNELLIDLDGVVDPEKVIVKLATIHRILHPIESAFARVSKSGKGLHVRVVFGSDRFTNKPIELNDYERCAFHAICGSDNIRELLRMRAIYRGYSDDTIPVFLDKPDHKETDITHRVMQEVLNYAAKDTKRKTK